MKTLYAILISGMAIISGALNGAQAQESIWSRQDPANGVYYGASTAEDILTRHQEAIAAAVIEHAMMINSSITGTVASHTTTSGTSTPMDPSTSLSSGYCSIEIIEYIDSGDMAEVLVRIDSKGNDYKYELKAEIASMESGGRSTFKSSNSLKLSDQSGKMLLYLLSQDTDKEHISKISFSSVQTK